jgi:hypothetical protein
VVIFAFADCEKSCLYGCVGFALSTVDVTFDLDCFCLPGCKGFGYIEALWHGEVLNTDEVNIFQFSQEGFLSGSLKIL